ncbi:MAG: hypothetical protein ACI4FY_03030 [Acetatifactor sp.]
MIHLKGSPPEELRELLRYIEDSSEENAVTENLRELHRMVTAVKRDREVGLAYMKSFEREQRIREQSREEGYEKGIHEGIREGRMESIRNMLAAKIDVTILLEAGFTMDEIEEAGKNRT